MILYLKLLSLLFSFGSFFVYCQPSITIFSSSNSPLPFNTVRCISMQNEVKWFGTDDGLAKFDGVNWTVFTTANSPLLDDNIRALCAENDSVIWIGTMQGGLYSFDGFNWINYNPSNSGLADFLVRGIAIDQENNIWCATSEGISVFDRTDWYTYTTVNNNLLTNNITAIAIGQQNEKFIATINGGLNYFTPSNQLSILSIVQSGLPDNSAVGIAVDSANHPWFATPAQGLVYDEGFGGPWLRFNMSNSPMPSNSLSAITIDETQRIFMGSEFGLIIKNQNSWQNFTTQNCNLPENQILCISTESNTVKWLGTNNSGVVRFEENQSNIVENKIDFYIYPTILKAGDYVFFSNQVAEDELLFLNQLGQIVDKIAISQTNYFKIPSFCKSGLYYIQLNSHSALYRIIVE